MRILCVVLSHQIWLEIVASVARSLTWDRIDWANFAWRSFMVWLGRLLLIHHRLAVRCLVLACALFLLSTDWDSLWIYNWLIEARLRIIAHFGRWVRLPQFSVYLRYPHFSSKLTRSEYRLPCQHHQVACPSWAPRFLPLNWFNSQKVATWRLLLFRCLIIYSERRLLIVFWKCDVIDQFSI